MLRTALVLISILLASAWTIPAEASMLCGPRTDIVRQLKENYSETLVGRGLAHNGTVLEVFASPSTTWTVLISYPNGMSCLLAIGEDWENHAPLVPGPSVEGPAIELPAGGLVPTD